VNGEVRCSCDPFYVDDGTGTCVLAPDPTCVAPHPNGDAFENDDCPQTAKELPVGATQNRTIDIAGDVDWMKATLEAGKIYRFECKGLDLKVYLFDASGTTQLAYRDDPEIIEYAPATSGQYLFKTQHYYETSTGSYTASLTHIGTDDHGNTAAHATPLPSLGSPISGTIEYGGDTDWFSFDAVAGSMYSVTTTGIDTVVAVYASDGTTLLKESDPVPFYVTATETGTHFVRVRHYSSTGTGAYTLTVTNLGAEVSGDSSATAGLIAPGASYGGMIDPAGDDDWYKFNTVAGHLYEINTTGIDTYLYLYDTDGTTLLNESDPVPMYLMATSAGPYFVRVRHYSSSGTGMYVLTVTDIGTDDHGNSASTATPLPLGPTGLTGRIVPAGDIDFFALDAVATHAYNISTTGIDTYLYLYAPDGTTLLKESDPVPVYLYAPQSGTYYVAVRHASSTGTGQYTITVEDVGADDHGNDASSASLAFTSGIGVDGVINYPGDDDWFKFEATANHLYSITTAPRSPTTYFDSYVYVYDTDGTRILKESDPVPVTFSAPLSGWYFVRIRHYYSTSSGHNYTLTITDLGTDDCGSGPATTCVLVPGPPPGTAVSGRIEVEGDDDWYAFDATAGHIYSCTTTGIDTYVYLIDTDGTTVLKAQDDPLVFLVAAQSGRYFYKVRAYSSSTTGTYDVLCVDHGPDDYPNGPVTAPVIPSDGTVQSGSVQYPGDTDWFAFVAEDGATYVIDNPPVGTADTVVELFAPDGATLLASADAPPTITRTLSAGTYYIKVRLYSTAKTGSYTLTVTRKP